VTKNTVLIILVGNQKLIFLGIPDQDISRLTMLYVEMREMMKAKGNIMFCS
jgi:hypothetical protein